MSKKSILIRFLITVIAYLVLLLAPSQNIGQEPKGLLCLLAGQLGRAVVESIIIEKPAQPAGGHGTSADCGSSLPRLLAAPKRKLKVNMISAEQQAEFGIHLLNISTVLLDLFIEFDHQQEPRSTYK